VTGKDLTGLDYEAGGHRIQRVPPTEKRGRVHTSTVTVAILEYNDSYSRLSHQDSDFRIEWFSGTGKGGQHRNKHQNSCRVHHISTGLQEARQGRHRESNLRDARAALEERLEAQARSQAHATTAATRKAQVGSGMRGDKIITIRFQDNRVQHHGTGKSMKASKYMRGFMDEVWT